MITRPFGMNVMDWADQALMDLDSYGAFGKLENPDIWREWAMQFLNNSVLGRNLPDPNSYTNWSDWAERLCGVLS